MTPYEIELAKALWSCSFPPGSSHKRFCRNMADTATHKPDHELSMRQRYYMEIMAWRYRRQLPERFVPHKKPLNLPEPVKLLPKRPRIITACPINTQPCNCGPGMACKNERDAAIRQRNQPDLFWDSGGKYSAA